MLIVQDVFTREKPLHIVISYNFEEQSVFVNGEYKDDIDYPRRRF